MRAITLAGACLSGLLVSACGGGGGGGGNNNPAPPAPTFTVGGSVSGLSGSGLVLQLNGAGTVAVAANGTFVFPAALATGTAFTVGVQTQPNTPSQTCAVAGATGTVGGANVTGITVTCTTNNFVVRGAVDGLAGGTVVLRLNGNQDVQVTQDGPFAFTTPVASGAAYDVTVQSQPSPPTQTCVPANNKTGTVGAADVAVNVTCTVNRYSVGGDVSGIIGSGLRLRLNGANDQIVTADGLFSFPDIPSGSAYNISVHTLPSNAPQRCIVVNEAGTVFDRAVTNVSVGCVRAYTVSGTVTGLTGDGLVLRINGGDDLSITQNGAFTFTTLLVPSQLYTVSVAASPSLPAQTCALNHPAGIIIGANVTDVEVECQVDRFAYVANFGSNDISGYTINSLNGDLTPLAIGPFAAGNGPKQLVSDPRGRFLYVSNTTANTVSGFQVDDITGALTPLPGSPYATGTQPVGIAIDSEGLWLFAANWGSDNVSVYSIGSNGALTQVPGSPFATGLAPYAVVTTPAHACCSVHVTNSGDDSVSSFELHTETGALTPATGSPYLAGHTPLGIGFYPTGEFVFVANFGSSSISSFARDAPFGTLIEVPDSPTSSSIAPCAMAAPRLSPTFFVVSSVVNGVAAFELGPNFAVFEGSSVVSSDPVGACGIDADLAGRFVYVVNPNTNRITAFTYSQTTGLVPSTRPALATGSAPQSIVIRYNAADRQLLGVPE